MAGAKGNGERVQRTQCLPPVMELVLCCVSFCRFAIQLSDDIFMVFRARTHTRTQSLIGSRLHLAKEDDVAVAVAVAVVGCACRLSCQFIFYNNSHKYRHAQRNDSKSTKRQTERDRNRVRGAGR